MLKTSRSWLKRNRSFFAVGAGVVGAGYLAGQYMLSKFTESRQRMSDDRAAKENLRRRFEQNQEDCSFTVLAILPTATANIFEKMPVEDTLADLQRQKADRIARSATGSEAASSVIMSGPTSTVGDDEGRSVRSDGFVHTSQILQQDITAPPRPKKSRAQLWDQMKIESISRAFALIYTLALLSLFTRIQLNLLGRRNYLASVISLASPNSDGRITLDNQDDDNLDNAYGSDYSTVRKYLSFTWWLLNRGCKDILDQVTVAVQEVFGPLNPRDDITLQRLSELTIEVRKKIEGVSDEDRKHRKWLHFMMPPVDEEEYLLRQSKTVSSDTPSDGLIPPILRRLLDESADLIDFPSFSIVLTHLLDAGFTHLTHSKVAPTAFKVPAPGDNQFQHPDLSVDPLTVKAKLASCLAVYCRQASAIGSGDATGGGFDSVGPHGGNEYLSAMENVPMLSSFAAVVYSSNFEYEMADPAEADRAGVSLFGEANDVNAAGTDSNRSSEEILITSDFPPEHYRHTFPTTSATPGMVSLGPITMVDETEDVPIASSTSISPPIVVSKPEPSPPKALSPIINSRAIDFDAIWNQATPASIETAHEDSNSSSSIVEIPEEAVAVPATSVPIVEQPTLKLQPEEPVAGLVQEFLPLSVEITEALVVPEQLSTTPFVAEASVPEQTASSTVTSLPSHEDGDHPKSPGGVQLIDSSSLSSEQVPSLQHQEHIIPELQFDSAPKAVVIPSSSGDDETTVVPVEFPTTETAVGSV